MSNDLDLANRPRHSFWPWSQVRQSRFVKDYFRQLLAEYKAICTTHPEPVARIEALDNGESISWAELHELEYLVLANLPLPVARRKLLILREQLRALAPREQYAALASVQIAEIDKANKDEIEAEGQALLSELQRLRAVQSQFEYLRTRIYLWFIGVALVFLLGTSVVATVHHYHRLGGPDPHPHLHLPMVLVVAMAGLLGAYFSVLLRLTKLSWSPTYSANYQQVDKMFRNTVGALALAMMEGGVAAAILYFLFMSGVVQCDLFPAFDVPSGKHLGFFAVAPKTAVDIAKALVWAVAAGFSERLVPDMLDNLAKRGSKPAPAAGTENEAPAPVKTEVAKPKE